MWVLWDPFEGLWNWTLVRLLQHIIPSCLHKPLAGPGIWLDTTILWARALWRRARRLGVRSLPARAHVPADVPVIYLDLGTHSAARELVLMATDILPATVENFRAYGFEAGREFFEEARARTASLKNVRMIHAAVCRPDHGQRTVRLYRHPGTGVASSLYRQEFGKFEEVPAIRLSSWLREEGIDVRRSVVLLRMNIEGAEEEVVEDLVESGLAPYVDGFLGMWDDVAKIDPERGKKFLRRLREHRIAPFTFNNRDFASSWRLQCITYEVHTALMQGLRKVERERRRAQR